MSEGVIGDFTVAKARDDELSSEIVMLIGELASLGVAAVRRRLEKAHGKTLVRNVFAKEWPSLSDEIGSCTAAYARECELRDAIRDVTGLSAVAVSKRLNAAHGKSLLRNLFGDEWPSAVTGGHERAPEVDSDDSDPAESSPPEREAAEALVGDLTAAKARDGGVSSDHADSIADLTDLNLADVRRRLAAAHGKMLVRNVFSNEWPSLADEIGPLTATYARLHGLRDVICQVTRLSPVAVTKRLNKAHGKTLLRNLFLAEWPGTVETAEIGNVSANDALNDPALAVRAASHFGLEVKVFLKKLHQVHGNQLLRNLFQAAGSSGRAAPAETSSVNLVRRRWEVLRSLGKGGFGEAFEARDTEFPNSPLVVLKFGTGSDAMACLKREFRNAGALSHPSICKYFHYDVDQEGRPFLVLEHGGRSLADHLEKEGEFAVARAVEVTRAVAVALDYAHERKVIHQDVAPGNVLIDADEIVRVTDFGVALLGTMKNLANGKQTMVGGSTSVGLPLFYSAPEVLTFGDVRRASDQFSLALLLCTMLEGKVFQEPHKRRAYSQLTTAQNEALKRALHMDPDARFETCLAFVNELLRAGEIQ
jgi:hypothetical protein